METTTYKIYTSIKQLPGSWDEVANENAFLQIPYLKVLEESAPKNMRCFYIGVFEKTELIGVALAQYLDLNKLESFGERDKCYKTYIRNFVFKNFASHALFLGNNMITGQNSYVFNKKMMALSDNVSRNEYNSHAFQKSWTSYMDFFQHTYFLLGISDKFLLKYYLVWILFLTFAKILISFRFRFHKGKPKGRLHY